MNHLFGEYRLLEARRTNSTGEYWVGIDGVRRQVYTRTIHIDYPNGYTRNPSDGHIISANNYGLSFLISIIEISGCRSDSDFLTNDESYIVNINDVMTAKVRGSGWGRILWFYGESYARPCSVTIKIK